MGSATGTLFSVFFREAGRALARHRARSVLTTLGITVGIASVVMAFAIGRSGADRVQAELRKLGDDLVWLEAGSRNVAGVRTGTRGTTSLTAEDAEAILREVPLIARVTPQIDGHVQVVAGNRNWNTHYRGGNQEYAAIRRWELALGENLTADDVDWAAAKVVLGQTVREQLFGGADPVGETVRLQGLPFEVVGVLAAKGQSPEGRDQDDWLLLPYTAAQRRLRGRGPMYLDDVFCSAVSAQAVEPAVERVVALMRQRHRIAPGQEDDFNIRRPDELLRAQAESARTLELLLVALASISLLVGGIGIMNVMLASVRQRTHEIGLRMAVGATGGAVRMQFLGEAAGLCLVGGVLGVLTSLAAASSFSALLGFRVSVPPSALLIAVASAVGVGLFFGFYPAWWASRLDPIEALRRE